MTEQLDLLSMVRSTDPDTSHAAAALTNRDAGMAKVMGVLTRWPDEPVTDDQIAERASMDEGSASKRRLDCQRKGWVEFAESYGASNSGAKARRWRVTPEGIAAWRAAA